MAKKPAKPPRYPRKLRVKLEKIAKERDERAEEAKEEDHLRRILLGTLWHEVLPKRGMESMHTVFDDNMRKMTNIYRLRRPEPRHPGYIVRPPPWRPDLRLNKEDDTPSSE